MRDLVKAQRLAAESAVDHRATHGGPRYILHGSGGRSALRLGTEVIEVIREHFPSFELGAPATVTDSGEPVRPESRTVNDCKKAKSVLGATIRSVEETIRDVWWRLRWSLGWWRTQIEDRSSASAAGLLFDALPGLPPWSMRNFIEVARHSLGSQGDGLLADGLRVLLVFRHPRKGCGLGGRTC